MSKYIGFDIDCKKVVACVVEKGKRDIYETMGPDVGSMRKFLLSQGTVSRSMAAAGGRRPIVFGCEVFARVIFRASQAVSC